MKKTVRFILLLSLVLICLSAEAQKLPNVQKTSLRVPANITIDGKATEWDNQFRAYNNATEIFYTIANNDDNLYLTVRATDPLVIIKLINGGITLTIQSAGKNSQSKVSITYPARDGGAITFRLKSKYEDTTVHVADSVMFAHNKILLQKCKWIKVAGIAGIDNMLSVYNQDGIEAAGLFNNKKLYTLEMGIPLKLLSLSVAEPSKFTYNLRINGVKEFGTIYNYTPTGNPANDAILEKTFAKYNADNLQQSSSTDFSGEYTLAKK
jgi:hypothetical protein